jgi:hypothetical protein
VQGICLGLRLGFGSKVCALIADDKSVDNWLLARGPRRAPQATDRVTQRRDRERQLAGEVLPIRYARADELQGHQSGATRLERCFDVLRNAWIFRIGHGR